MGGSGSEWGRVWVDVSERECVEKGRCCSLSAYKQPFPLSLCFYFLVCDDVNTYCMISRYQREEELNAREAKVREREEKLAGMRSPRGKTPASPKDGSVDDVCPSPLSPLLLPLLSSHLLIVIFQGEMDEEGIKSGVEGERVLQILIFIYFISFHFFYSIFSYSR